MSMAYSFSRGQVLLTHIPTGITAKANEHRSQRRNRDSALAQLKGKIAMGSVFPLPERASYELPDDRPNPDDLTQFKIERSSA